MDPWITKAEHALRTGQPKLAELYMRRGLSESPAGRSWLAWRDFTATLTKTGRAVVDVFRQAGLLDDPPRTSYALAGPPKAGS
jgi:hypothetical protein